MLSFFSLARCRLQLQAEKLAGGGRAGTAPPRTALASAHKQAPVGSPTTELKAVPPRPALPLSARPWFQASVVSIPMSGLIRNQTGQLLATAVLIVPLWMSPGGPCDMRDAGCGLRIASVSMGCPMIPGSFVSIYPSNPYKHWCCCVWSAELVATTVGAASSRGRQVVCLCVQRKSGAKSRGLVPKRSRSGGLFPTPNPWGIRNRG